MTLSEDTTVDWTPYSDLHLINSLGGMRAIGLNHNVHMIITTKRFNAAMRTNVNLETVRNRLKTFYDFQAAERLVGEIPFPTKPVAFALPSRLKAKMDERTSAFKAAKLVKKTPAKKVPPVDPKTPTRSSLPPTKKKKEVKDDKKTSISRKRASQRKETPIPAKRRR